MRTEIIMTIALAAASAASAESLWHSGSNSETSMFADRKAMSIGDILTVVVDESLIVTRNSSKNTSSTTQLTHDVDSFLFPGTETGFGKHNGALPRIGLSPGDSFSGEGSFSDTNIVEAQISVSVVDVLPNGNLVFEGARKIAANGERQFMVLRGTVRGDDILSNNTVMSYHIVNSSIEILGEGDLMTAQRKGWINQVLDKINIL